MPRKPDVNLCYREAGHAVIGIILGVNVQYADVYRNISRGRYGFCKSIAGFGRGLDSRIVIMDIAGTCAEAISTGIDIASTCFNIGYLDNFDKCPDYKRIKAYMGLFKDEDSRELFLHLSVKTIYDILSEPTVWRAVERVKDYLYDHWRIEGDEVKQIVLKTIPNKKMNELRMRYTGSV
jgi:hypothetical protein